MISYLILKNYKSFSDVTIDLRERNGSPKKIALIYGENGAGKSNLISSLFFLTKTLSTLSNAEKMTKLNTDDIIQKIIGANQTNKQMIFDLIMNTHFYTLEDLIKENKTRNAKEPMCICIGFHIDGKNGEYLLEFDDHNVVKEELKYCIKERMGKIFSCEQKQCLLSPSIFVNASYQKELFEKFKKYWGKHTLLSILRKEMEDKNEIFMNNVIQPPLFRVFDFFNRFAICCKVGTIGEKGRLTSISNHFSHIENGTANIEELPKLKATEKMLNAFYTSLYSDVKKVFYKYETAEELSYSLYFLKEIGGNLIEIPFTLESTGTQKLLEILPYLLSSITGEISLVDEMDSGIHDVLMCKLFELIQEQVNGQLIVTTHNTLLMKKISPENCYIVNIDANGDKAIRCIKDFKFRTQANHNVQHKYLNGDYDGIPNIGYLDLDELVQDFFDEINSTD